MKKILFICIITIVLNACVIPTQPSNKFIIRNKQIKDSIESSLRLKQNKINIKKKP